MSTVPRPHAGCAHLQVVQARVEGLRFCVPLEQVQRVFSLVELQPVPGAPDYLKGLIDIGGEGVPAIDVGQRAGLARHGSYDLQTSILLCRHGRLRGGLIVDQIDGIAAADRDPELDALFAGGIPVFLAAVRTAGRLSLLLDVGRILAVDLSRAETELRIDSAFLNDCRAHMGIAAPEHESYS